MKAVVVAQRFGDYRRPVGDKSLAEQITDKVNEHGEPTEIHFSTAQTTGSGGQFGHYSALLIWRDKP